MEEVKINFYEVYKCGYYKWGEKNPEFGVLGDLLKHLVSWAFDGKKKLSETCTYRIEDDSDSVLHTFCFDYAEGKNGDFILVTWNETETLDGAMASVDGDEVAGAVHVNTTDIPEGHIPGYPTYFWFVPGKNLFATLRFNQRVNGHPGLKSLFRAFLERVSPHVLYDNEGDDEENIAGYIDGDDEIADGVSPSFKSGPKRIPGAVDFIRKNRVRIKKIIRKGVLAPEVADDRSFWEKCLHNLGVVDAPPLSNETKIKAEFPYLPSKQELDHIIEEWEQESDSKWINVGFDLEGEEEIKWLSHSLVKATLNMKVEKNAEGIIKAVDIMSEIDKNRQYYFGESGG